MIPQVSCKIYESEKIKKEVLRERLKDYRKEYYEKGLSKPIIENIEKFSLVNNGVEFVFLFDYVVPIPYREETQKVLKTSKAEVKIIILQNHNLYLIYSSSKIADSVRIRLSRILSNTDDFIEKIKIPTSVLREIEKNDAIEIKYGWWDGIETYARKGALKGNLSRSRFYSEFENFGDPTLITFESRSTGRTIRITSQGIITFYGENITKQEIENYIIEWLVPRLRL